MPRRCCGVIQRRRAARVLLEPDARVPWDRQARNRKDLDGDVSIELLIAGPTHTSPMPPAPIR
jgi:hypothetical protein